MATFTHSPTSGSSVNTKSSIREAKFGDGYSQRSPDGIYNLARMWEVRFAGIPTDDANAIVGFLTARGGYESFDWTPPSGVAGKFFCRAWSDGHDSYGIQSISATFEEVFGE